MKTHPVAPLTEANKKFYQKIQRAKRKLKQATSIDERIELKAQIGEATSQIWRLKRKESK